MSNEKEITYFDKFLDDICENEKKTNTENKTQTFDSWGRLLNKKYGEDYLNNIRYKK